MIRWSLLLILLCGCAVNPQSLPQPLPEPPIDSVAWSAELAPYKRRWEKEVGKRFPRGALVIICHGNNFGYGWRLYPDPPLQPMDANTIAQVLHSLDPDRPVVLVTCNPKGDPIWVENVFYAKADVWNPPNVRIPSTQPGVNNIWQFVEGERPITIPTTRPR